ncbi:MAG: DNA photolyase family protein [Verrucomicrobiaceae bacterium]|nr:DNA photolyase family protein [Verrucomicrobiaceae bacterium]
MAPVIHWFRRDLRLTDNTALHHAAEAGSVIPAYVLSTWKREHGWTGPLRQSFLCGCLQSLAANLEHLHSRLIIRAGDAVAELEKLAVETRAAAIFFNRDPDPFGKATEVRVRAMCGRLGIRCESFKDTVLHDPDEVLTGEGQPYRVFTPYSKNWLGLPKAGPLPRPSVLGPAPKVASLPLPAPAYWQLEPVNDPCFPLPGERAARGRMKHFVDDGILAGYAMHRDEPHGQSTSMLSQDLRFGLISIRELFQRTQRHAKFVQELAWREFYMAILHHWPEVLDHEFNPQWRGMAWPGTNEHFTRWREGRTGFPIVDAGMRQLLTTGLMHNRVRMIVAMFLTKDLHCDWRWGEQFFHQHLVDAEIASNNGGWQWSAGTGADAAPYFRIQNPWSQTRRYDPEARYIKHWLPELRHVPVESLVSPPSHGGSIAAGYPPPMVDHAVERERTLALFAQHRARHGRA